MPNAVYQKEGTRIVFDSAATDVDWSTESVANNAGRQSAQADLGVLTTPRTTRYRVRFWCQLQATPTIGNAVRLYVKSAKTTSAATARAANDDGLGDAAVSAEDKLRNLQYVGAIIVDEAAANVEMVLESEVVLTERYVQLVFWNASGAAITSDTTETGAELIPIYDEIQ